MKRLHRLARGVVAYNLFVILFGAWVRISGSGAGCGEHWPTCNGEVIPRAMPIARVIELTHRLTSGLSLVLVVGLLAFTFRLTRRGHAARKSALAMLVFVLLEALIGAGLVLFGLVDKNSSATRAVVIALHLVNTLGLLASGALTAHFSAAERKVEPEVSERPWLIAALAAIALVAATGAITALGDTLLPAQSISADHFLVRLRVVHPVLALLAAGLLTFVSRLARLRSDAQETQRYAKLLVALTHTQVLIGVTNIVLNAPGWMQLVHLLVANLVWLSLVMVCASRFRPRVSA